MNDSTLAYGLWSLVLLNSAIFIMFAFSFFKPQYVAFVLILFGFLLQWPTVLTLLMFPVLLIMYGRLAITEEVETRARFGAEFDRYAACNPRFIPRVGQARKTA